MTILFFWSLVVILAAPAIVGYFVADLRESRKRRERERLEMRKHVQRLNADAEDDSRC